MTSIAPALSPPTRWDRAADLVGAGLHSMFASLALFVVVGSLGILSLLIFQIGARSPMILAIGVAGLLIQLPQMLLMLMPVCLVALPLAGALLRGRGTVAGLAFGTVGMLAGHIMAAQPFAKPAFGVLEVLLGPIMLALGVYAGIDFVSTLRRGDIA